MKRFFSAFLIFCVTFSFTGGLKVNGQEKGYNLNSVNGPVTFDSSMVWEESNGLICPRYTNVEFSNDRYVITCSNGSIMHSLDGINWETEKVCNDSLTSSAGGKNGYVAVGEKGAVVYSENGADWASAGFVGTGENLNSVIYDVYSDKFIAVGNFGTIIHSVDGKKWNVIKNNMMDNILGIATDGSKYIAITRDKASVSTNLSEWTPLKVIEEGSMDFYNLTFCKIIFAGEKWFIIPYREQLFTSDDGENWISCQHIFSKTCHEVIYDGSKHIAFSDNPLITKNPKGTWQSIENTVRYSMNDYAYGNGVYVGVGPGTIISSRGLDSWSEVSVKPTGTYKLIKGKDCVLAYVYENSAYGAITRLYYSKDGVSWNKGIVINNTISVLKYAGDKFIITFVDKKNILVSADGINWAGYALPDTANLVSIRDADKKDDEYLFIDTKKIYITKDFISWRVVSIDNSIYMNSIASNQDVCVVAAEGNIYVSRDLIEWTSVRKTNARNVIWNDKRFICFNGDIVLTSLDGYTWYVSSENLGFNEVDSCTSYAFATNFSRIYKTTDYANWDAILSVVDTYYNCIEAIEWFNDKLIVMLTDRQLLGRINTPSPTNTPTGTTTGTPSPTPSNGYTISGFVKPDISSPNVLKSGIKVELENTSYTTVTDNNGYFEFQNVPENDTGYTIKISKQIFLTRTIKNLVFNRNTQLGTPDSPVELWAGDVIINGKQDNAINLADIMKIAESFNSKSGDLNFNPDYDLNVDNSINLTDIMIVAKHFNKAVSNYPQVTLKQ